MQYLEILLPIAFLIYMGSCNKDSPPLFDDIPYDPLDPVPPATMKEMVTKCTTNGRMYMQMQKFKNYLQERNKDLLMNLEFVVDCQRIVDFSKEKKSEPDRVKEINEHECHLLESMTKFREGLQHGTFWIGNLMRREWMEQLDHFCRNYGPGEGTRLAEFHIFESNSGQSPSLMFDPNYWGHLEAEYKVYIELVDEKRTGPRTLEVLLSKARDHTPIHDKMEEFHTYLNDTNQKKLKLALEFLMDSEQIADWKEEKKNAAEEKVLEINKEEQIFLNDMGNKYRCSPKFCLPIDTMSIDQLQNLAGVNNFSPAEGTRLGEFYVKRIRDDIIRHVRTEYNKYMKKMDEEHKKRTNQPRRRTGKIEKMKDMEISKKNKKKDNGEKNTEKDGKKKRKDLMQMKKDVNKTKKNA